MIQWFIENCEISIGVRIIYWDIALIFLGQNKDLWWNEGEPTLDSYFAKHYLVEHQECKNMISRYLTNAITLELDRICYLMKIYY
jgi:hypothetical protein